MNSIVFLGASRGLGAAVLDLYQKQQTSNLFLFARTAKSKEGDFNKINLDFTRAQDQRELIEKLEEIRPDRIFYFAGGGPYGKFGEQKLAAHQWAMELNFNFPMSLLHWAFNVDFVQQIIFTGSAIAESAGDAKAASYAAAKHSLLGLVESIYAEGSSKDLRLFSPGYMNTGLLPPNTEIRRSGKNLLSPQRLAQQFQLWAEESTDVWHLKIKTESQFLK